MVEGEHVFVGAGAGLVLADWDKRKIMDRMVKDIAIYDKIIIFDADNGHVLNEFLKRLESGNKEKNYLLISCDGENEHGRTISKEGMRKLIAFCYMYEFTDRITIISDDSAYPGLLNYLKTGLLSVEECVQAILDEGRQHGNFEV